MIAIDLLFLNGTYLQVKCFIHPGLIRVDNTPIQQMIINMFFQKNGISKR